ncbi:hypothetical protein CTZ27_27490 [Streptomyces griseocarneus]|nr:hypothetical protein CTZ27_27490 [Streptomyces griseocarneus]
MAPLSQAARHTLRTVLQTAVGLAVALPAIVDASGIPASLPWAAGALAVAGGLTRVMALPAVQTLLPAWLRTGPPSDPDADLRALATAAEDRGRA